MPITKTKQGIPKGWQRIKLSDECVFERGIEPGSENYFGDSSKGKRFLRVSDLSGSRDGKIYIDIETDKIAGSEDILLTLDGSVGIVKKGLEGIYSTGIRKVYFKKKQNQNEFLYFILQSKRVQDTLREHSIGSTIKHAGKAINYIHVSIPTDSSEQQKIAEILGAVDEEIQKTDEIISATEKLKRGLMRQLFTRGIGHTKFKNTEIGEIPVEWSVLKLRDVAKFTNGKAHEKDIKEDGKYIVINSKFISTNGEVIKRSDKNLSPLIAGDVAMVMSDIPKGRALSKCFFVEENDKYTLNQRICSLRATKMIDKFLYCVLNRNPYFLGFDNGVGQTNLRKDEVLNCPVQVPSEDEQRKIVELLSSLDEKIAVNKKLKAELTILKKGLMQDLLSGKKRTI